MYQEPDLQVMTWLAWFPGRVRHEILSTNHVWHIPENHGPWNAGMHHRRLTIYVNPGTARTDIWNLNAKALRSLCQGKSGAGVSDVISEQKIRMDTNKNVDSSGNRTETFCVVVKYSVSQSHARAWKCLGKRPYIGIMSRQRQLWLQWWLSAFITM